MDRATDWLQRHRTRISGYLHSAGALLIRNLAIRDACDFQRLCCSVTPALKRYVGGDSPRTRVTDLVYTSTEYPAHLEIALHNELSYADWWPDLVFFACLQPPDTGGETPLGDGRLIYSRLDPVIRGRFIDRGVMYLQHLHDENGEPGPAKSWQQTFETQCRESVENRLNATNTKFSWTEKGLKTWTVRDAVIAHPVSGQLCWHNQAHLWHKDLLVTTDDDETAQLDPILPDSDGPRQHVTYADRTEIDIDDLLHVRAVTRDCEVAFKWQRGDLLLIDNASTLHGRKAFTGKRDVVVAMA